MGSGNLSVGKLSVGNLSEAGKFEKKNEGFGLIYGNNFE